MRDVGKGNMDATHTVHQRHQPLVAGLSSNGFRGAGGAPRKRYLGVKA